MKRTSRGSMDHVAVARRRFLGTALCACTISPLGLWSMQFAASMSGVADKRAT